MHSIDYPCDGDIILVHAGKKNAAIFGQRMHAFLGLLLGFHDWRDWGPGRRLKRLVSGKWWNDIQISHVGITVAPTGYIDSNPRKGVDLSTWPALLRYVDTGLTVLRHVDATGFDEAIIGAAVDNYGRGYNYLMHLKKFSPGTELKDREFCSELVEKFHSADRLGFTQSPGRTLHPNDFRQLLENQQWVDVTALYLPYIRGELSAKSASFDWLDQIRSGAANKAAIKDMNAQLAEVMAIADAFPTPEQFEADLEKIRQDALAESERLMERKLSRMRRQRRR